MAGPEFGQSRREDVQDGLAGAGGQVPTVQVARPSLAAPLSGARTQAPKANQYSTAIFGQLNAFSEDFLDKSLKSSQSSSMLRGQIAALQGDAIDSLEMEGDKFAVEGYKMVQAQELASGLLLAQAQEIQDGAHAKTPDEYREILADRMQAVLSGTADRRTLQLAEMQLAQQLPTLIAGHTKAHIAWAEEQNFNTLSSSIDTISRDPAAIDTLVAFARGGPGSATASLSDGRRRAALVEGVRKSFANNNPLAYAALSQDGLLTDGMSADQINSIEDAKTKWERKARSEYNETMFREIQSVSDRTIMGEVGPMAAVQELAGVYSKWHITMTNQDAGAVYSNARASHLDLQQERTVLISEAQMRGDFDTVANMTVGEVIYAESGGNPDLLGPVITAGANTGHRAVGLMQVMPITAENPGFGIRPAADASPEEYERVGREYWAAMVNRYGGDIEAAAIGYNAGPANADKWVESGRDYSVLPKRSETEPYAKGIVARSNQTTYQTASERLADAESKRSSTASNLRTQATEAKAEARREATAAANAAKELEKELALEHLAAASPLIAQADANFRDGINGTGPEAERVWREELDAIYDQWDIARTREDINRETRLAQEVSRGLLSADPTAYGNRASEAHLEMEDARVQFDQRVNDFQNNRGDDTVKDMQSAIAEYRAERRAIAEKWKVPIRTDDENTVAKSIADQMLAAVQQRREHDSDQVRISVAESNGGLGMLEPKLQKQAFNEATKSIVEEWNARATRENLPQEIVQAGIQNDLLNYSVSSGAINPDLHASINGMLSDNLITDKDGTPSAQVVEAMETYKQMREVNPTLAERYLTPANRSLANVILNRAGEGPVANAVRSIGMESMDAPTGDDVAKRIASSEVQSAVDASIDDYLARTDIGLFQSVFWPRADLEQRFDRTTTARVRLHSEENRYRIRGLLEQEMTELQRMHPGLKPSTLVAEAHSRVDRRAAAVGGDIVITPRGKDIRRDFFGEQAGTVDQEDAINAAVMTWLRSEDAQTLYPELSETSIWEQIPLTQTTSDFLNFVYPFGDIVEAPTMGWDEAWSAGSTGVRPFAASTNPITGQIQIQVLTLTGDYGGIIPIPSKEAGKMYLDKLREKNSD